MSSRSDAALPRRVAMVSLHTSPLSQPGGGDAGGMNVYVAQTARRLGRRGVEVEIFTRATDSDQPPAVPAWPGVTVRHVVAGPFGGLDKNDLPDQLCAFTAGVLLAEARHEPGAYDLVHSHYWLSGQVGRLAAQRWAVPLVHSAHTLARVKNAALRGEAEPGGRLRGEDELVAEATRLIANTEVEKRELIAHYGADPARIDVVSPGVDTEVFRPGARDARAEFGVEADAALIVFAGRLQPFKGPDVAIRALAELRSGHADRPVTLLLAGGVSGSSESYRQGLVQLAADLGIAGQVRFEPPMAPERLARLFRAADVVAVPSLHESFGLVALEAQACGTPVVAAAVGGLPVAVVDGVTGRLVAGHGPADWAAALAAVLFEPGVRSALAAAAATHAARFSWDATVDELLAGYRRALRTHPAPAGSGRR